MAGVNKVILLGNLGADPETSILPSGVKVCKINIATSESYVKDGQKVDNTEWHRVELWDKLADIASTYLKKGSTVYIEGKIKTEKYTDSNGIEKSVTKIRGTAISLVGSKQESANNATQSGNAPQAPQNAPSVSELPSDGGDDLPF